MLRIKDVREILRNNKYLDKTGRRALLMNSSMFLNCFNKHKENKTAQKLYDVFERMTREQIHGSLFVLEEIAKIKKEISFNDELFILSCLLDDINYICNRVLSFDRKFYKDFVIKYL